MNNREIKFRGKRIDNGEWIVGSLDNSDNRECFILYRNEKHEPYSVRVNPRTVGQFTGIKDRGGKGVEVFDGDKIGRTSFWDKEIIWDKSGFYTISVNNPERKFPLTYLDEFDVVIGNIHDNPEINNHGKDL